MSTYRRQQTQDQSDYVDLQVILSRIMRRAGNRQAYEDRVRLLATRRYRRSESRRKRNLPTVPLESLMNRDNEPATHPFLDIIHEAEDAQHRAIAMIEQLKGNAYAFVRLRYLEGLTTEDIAASFRVTERHVNRVISDALDRLRAKNFAV